MTPTGSGLINVNQYYSATSGLSTGPDDPAERSGLLEYSGVQQGSGGSPVWQSFTDYIAATLNGNTSYFTSSSTQYQSADEGDPETTDYQYTFYPDNGSTGSGVGTETTMLPEVDTDDGGTGSAPTSTDVYNFRPTRLVAGRQRLGQLHPVRPDHRHGRASRSRT